MRASRGAAALTLATLGLAAACQASEETPAPVAVAELELGGDVVPIVSFHTRYGFPGPWSRERGRRQDFERDSRTCLGRSNEARRQAADGDGNDAAYRGFIQCMEDAGWTRGTKPKPAEAAAAEATPETAS